MARREFGATPEAKQVASHSSLRDATGVIAYSPSFAPPTFGNNTPKKL